jgi:hypothetical protein
MLTFIEKIFTAFPCLALNQISCEPSSNGRQKLRIYFCFWDREKYSEKDNNDIMVPLSEFPVFVEAAKLSGGETSKSEDIAAFIKSGEDGEMCFDTVGFEYSSERLWLKTYVRPILNTHGDGLRWPM